MSTHARRGISLLEVLIATFVAAVGLLGLISLIPVGKYQINEGTKNDRGATIGRAAVREVQVRDMLNPEMWLPVTDNANASYTGPWFDRDAHNAPQLPEIATDWGNSVCIDPLFIARNLAAGGTKLKLLGQFPYPLNQEKKVLDDGKPKDMPNPPRMTRVSLRALPVLQPLLPPVATPRMDTALAERIFTLQDDLLFEQPDDNVRPNQLFARDKDDTALHRQFAGDYTWLVTLTPVERGDVDALQRNLYTVSVVVFYKRPMIAPAHNAADRTDGPPSERLVFADLLGGSLGFGGGDVRLWLPNPSISAGNPTDMPYTRAGQWLMLAHWVPDRSLLDKGAAQAATQGYRAVFRWYRVVATEGKPVYDANNNQSEQYVSLVGSDMQPLLDADGKNQTRMTVHAALFDGVVAVYQKTMRFER